MTTTIEAQDHPGKKFGFDPHSEIEPGFLLSESFEAQGISLKKLDDLLNAVIKKVPKTNRMGSARVNADHEIETNDPVLGLLIQEELRDRVLPSILKFEVQRDAKGFQTSGDPFLVTSHRENGTQDSPLVIRTFVRKVVEVDTGKLAAKQASLEQMKPASASR